MVACAASRGAGPLPAMIAAAAVGERCGGGAGDACGAGSSEGLLVIGRRQASCSVRSAAARPAVAPCRRWQAAAASVWLPMVAIGTVPAGDGFVGPYALELAGGARGTGSVACSTWRWATPRPIGEDVLVRGLGAVNAGRGHARGAAAAGRDVRGDDDRG
ncbi:MAG: hypothetical protein U5L11_11365 [Arhodomonas sp.]|nr:hypothetical protein [Arhodomonas sp.]